MDGVVDEWQQWLEATQRWWCFQCASWQVGNAEEMAAHIETHDQKAERWSDGGLVVDMSEVPELLEEE